MEFSKRKKLTIHPKIRCHFLYLEDRRFFNHRGIDYWRSFKCLFKFILGLNTGGASTIEQQLVRTITQNYQRSVKRKIIELILAKRLAKNYNKDFILNYYLSICYFGTGLYGIDQTSQKIFGKSCRDLSNFECSYIASLAKYPKPLEDNSHWTSKHRNRTNYSLNFFDNKLSEPISIMSFYIFKGHLNPVVISQKLLNEYRSINDGFY
ncbi:biosynthetic peptidoglycan transglycosylase [Legionella bozemanae]|uniref:biosynthetic peptidoglycan transglycosylase n=1 Tax=Legionella bozemanae TaxID=447 RepID=UPI003EF0731F